MKTKLLRISISAVIAVLMSIPGFAAAPSGTNSNSVTKSWVIHKGTSDYARTRDFLLREGTTKNGGAEIDNLAADRLGDFVVTATLHYNSVEDMREGLLADETNPPYPPPGGTHQVGDTYTVSTCSSGETQSWTYTYEVDSQGHGEWVETSYSDVKSKSASCISP